MQYWEKEGKSGA